jgi:hypothetical protein
MRFHERLLSKASIAILVCCSAIFTGCMFEPANESDVCAVDQPMTFSGQVLAGGSLVRIEAADNPAGPFTHVTEVFAGPRSSLTGTAIWRTGAVVDDWSATLGSAGIRETFIRAWVGTTSFPFYLRTYDSAEVAGETGIQCIIRTAADQQISILFAASICQSPTSPIARVRAADPGNCACPTQHTGDLILTNVETIHLYRCLQDLDGNLIVPKGYPDTVSLPDLVNVDGNVLLDYTPEGYSEPARTIDLPLLTDIGGDLEVLFDLYSYDTTIFPVGLDAVTDVGGEIRIISEVAFPNYFGLSGITSHFGNVTITAPTDGLGGQILANLATITGDVHLEFTQAFENPLPGLQTLNGNLTIVDWADFNTPGLSQLAIVTGDVTLQDLDFPAQMFAPSLAVGGNFDVIGESAGDLSLYAGSLLTAGALVLDTTDLTQFNAAHVQVQGSGTIEIVDNPCLEANEISAFLSDQQLGGWTGSAIVSGNGGGPMCP